MAGGVANIWGKYLVNSPNVEMSDPYENVEWIRTYSRFLRDRFKVYSQRDNSISNGVALRSWDEIIIYKEDASRIEFSIDGPVTSAIAVDATKEYCEIDILDAIKSGVWVAPSISDWAIHMVVSRP